MKTAPEEKQDADLMAWAARENRKKTIVGLHFVKIDKKLAALKQRYLEEQMFGEDVMVTIGKLHEVLNLPFGNNHE